MKSLNELLREADPIRHEPPLSPVLRESRRRAVLKATYDAPADSVAKPRSGIFVFATAACMVVATALLVGLLSSTFVSNLQAAIRFEVRLAEVNPAAGLHKALESGSDHPIYLHNEVVVTNSDIAAARVVPGSEASQFDISLEFTDSGAKKMLGATANHLGRPMAILLDGRVVMAPLLRSPIEKSAMITGNFSKTQAERIVRGIEIH